MPQQAQDSGSDEGEEPCVAVAKTEIFLFSWALWQEGHSGVSPERINFSNSAPQLAQRYSNIGMGLACENKGDSTAAALPPCAAYAR